MAKINKPLSQMTFSQAENLARQRNLTPDKYGATLAGTWTNQGLADALNVNIVKRPSRSVYSTGQKILATPTATKPPPTREDVLSQARSLGDTTYGITQSPYNAATDVARTRYLNQVLPGKMTPLKAMAQGVGVTPEELNAAYMAGQQKGQQRDTTWTQTKAELDSRGAPGWFKIGSALVGAHMGAQNLGSSLIPDPALQLTDAAKVGLSAYSGYKSPENISTKQILNIALPTPTLAEGGLVGYAEGGKKKPNPFDELEPTFGDRIGAAAADKLTEAGLWLYDKLADRDKLSSAHKIYLDTFVHDKRDPITAKDFNPQDLVELQNLIRQKEKLTGNKGTGYIQYEDYKTLPGGDQRRGVAANLTGGVLPPRASLSKSLGQFNYERDPKTGQYRIIDEYDFNPQTITAGGEKVEVPPEFYGDYVETAGFSPYALARLYGGRKMPPGKGRKVDLSVLGKAEGGLMKYNPDEIAQLAASVVPGYAQGGIVSEDQAGVNRMVDQQNAAEGGYMAYAAGGLVNYDPAEIDTIVSRIREELHG